MLKESEETLKLFRLLFPITVSEWKGEEFEGAGRGKTHTKEEKEK